MVAVANTVNAIGKVAHNKPRLRNKITTELVKVDTLPHSAGRRNILIGHSMLAFDNYIDEIKNKKEIKRFAEKHIKNRRNATRDKAIKPLNKMDN